MAPWREIDILITTDVARNRPMCEAIRAQGTQVITPPLPPETDADA